MASATRGLGRGLDALFKNTPGSESGAKTLPLASIQPNPQQPRKHFSPQQLDELAASIQAQGLLQPILVRPLQGSPGMYEIIAGERRWRASQRAGLVEVAVVVRDMNDQEALLVALMENLQREDLTPLEEAQGMQQLKEEFGLSQEDLASRLGKSRSAIANTLRLLALPEKAREDLASGRLSAGHARALLAVSDPESQELLRAYLVHKHATVREAEDLAAAWKESGALPAHVALLETPARATPAAPGKPQGTMTALQESLTRLLALPVSISGKESRGRISVKYNSKEELAVLLQRLGHSGE